MTENKKKKSSIISRIILVIILGFIVTILYSCVTGELRYIETFRMPGESRGYLGRRSRIMDSEESFKKVWDELREKEEFKGKEIKLNSIYISTERLSLVIQDPENSKYFDEYVYNGNSLLPKWSKRDPQKNFINDTLIDINDLNISGIYKFYSKMVEHVENNNIELKKDYPYTINISPPSEIMPNLTLRGFVTGVREDLSFEADKDGESFEVK